MSPLFDYWANYLVAALFAIGLFGFLVRKNALALLMSVELMLNAVNLCLAYAAAKTQTPAGIILVVFSITIAAAEVAIGLAIVLNLYRAKGSVDVELFNELKG